MESLKFNNLGQWILEKSNYGPKGIGLYDPIVNAKRKAKNVETVENIGPNSNVKTYTSTSTGMSAKEMADKEAKNYNKLNRKQPVKRYTPEELAQYKQAKAKIAKNGQWSLE